MSEFDKAVKHVKTCLFWDFVDGQWLEKLYTPLDKDFFNRLMQGVVEAHEAENAKLRELVADMWRFTGAACKKYPRLFDPAAQGPQMVQLNALDSFEQRMRELGIEVSE